MAFSSHRTRFQGELAGIKQEEITKLDYTKEELKDRKKYIEDKYSKIEKYHEEYTSEYYKCELNTNDNLSEDINVFKSIERDANYILNSLDVAKDRQQQYAFLDEFEFKKLEHKERLNLTLDNPDVMNIVKPAFKNVYLSNDLVIKKNDLKDEVIGEILTDYERVRTHLKEEMAKLKNKSGSRYDLGFIKRNLGTLQGDMVDCKRILKVVLRPSNKLGDIGSQPDYNTIKYSNPAHIKAIITNVRFGEINPDSMLSHISYDIEKAVRDLCLKKRLDELDLEIINCLNDGLSERATAEELGKGKTTIQQRVSKICERIASYYTYFEIVKLG